MIAIACYMYRYIITYVTYVLHYCGRIIGFYPSASLKIQPPTSGAPNNAFHQHMWPGACCCLVHATTWYARDGMHLLLH